MGIVQAYRKYRLRRLGVIACIFSVFILSPFIYSGIRSLIPEPKFNLFKLMNIERKDYEDGAYITVYKGDILDLTVNFFGANPTNSPSFIRGKASEMTVSSILEEAVRKCRYHENKYGDRTFLYMDSGMLVFQKKEFRYYRQTNNLKPFQ